MGVFWIKYLDYFIGHYQMSYVIHGGSYLIGRKPRLLVVPVKARSPDISIIRRRRRSGSVPRCSDQWVTVTVRYDGNSPAKPTASAMPVSAPTGRLSTASLTSFAVGCSSRNIYREKVTARYGVCF